MQTVELTRFQVESLQEVANSGLQTYMLCKPSAALDGPVRYAVWLRNNLETDELVKLGLLTDVSSNFSNKIEEHAQQTGRTFRVLKITDAGKLMFSEGHSSPVTDRATAIAILMGTK